MKLSKEELKKRIDEVIEDEDVKISLLEDIEDSFDVAEEDAEKVEKSVYDDLQLKYDDLKERYIKRFLDGEEKENKDDEEDEEELEEEEIIDIQEI